MPIRLCTFFACECGECPSTGWCAFCGHQQGAEGREAREEHERQAQAERERQRQEREAEWNRRFPLLGIGGEITIQGGMGGSGIFAMTTAGVGIPFWPPPAVSPIQTLARPAKTCGQCSAAVAQRFCSVCGWDSEKPEKPKTNVLPAKLGRKAVSEE